MQLSSFEPGSKIPGHGKPTSHIPELILNNFGTRLGRRTGRFLGSLFPHVCVYIKYMYIYVWYVLYVCNENNYKYWKWINPLIYLHTTIS